MSKLLLALFLISVVKSDNPIKWDGYSEDLIERNAAISPRQTVYRLPENVIPIEYDIDIDLNVDENTGRPIYSYTGKVSIIIQAVVTNVTEIVLHANVDSIDSISLTSNGVPVTVNVQEPITLEPLYHFLRINLVDTLQVGVNYTLAIGYSSTMNEGPLRRGIWRGHYRDANNVLRTYITTHFQPYNARQAFPCWDEPLFKAVFKLHLTRPANYNSVFSNTVIDSSENLPDGRVKDTFSQTPKMSSYLLTFLVSESFQVIAEDTSFDPPVRIIGRSNTVGHGDFALKLAVGMTNFFDEYFEIPYSSLHANLSNDHISSPDWASAGTENWGMVSYRELYLIVDRTETIMSIEHYAATLISHELAHKWFGNLITCYWWSNTWINEGFASYFGYIATHGAFPEYEHDEHFNSRYLQLSLSFDSGTSTVPMNYDVNTPPQVTGHFGTISYSKGAAFLRMTADLITADTFRKACRYFLIDNAYEATYPQDLFVAFERAALEDETLTEYLNFNFTEYYDVWVNQPGYPILNVDIDYSSEEMILTQERFFLSASAAPTGQIYPLPVTYSTQSNPSFLALKPTYVLRTDSAVLPKPGGEEWVIFNNLQHGHYRVNYNDRNWELLSEALLSNPDSIHHLNRAQIVDDVYALMRSGRMTYNFGFRILRFLRTETNFHVWDPAITMYNFLRNRLRHLPNEHATLTSFILSYMEHAIGVLGYDADESETPTISLTRQDMLHFACLLGHSRCIQESKQRFDALKTNDQWVDPRIRRNVFVVGIREGDEEDFNFLLNRFLTSNYANDKLEMLRALAATRNTSLLERYLQMILEDEVRTQDKSTALNYALLGNLENAPYVMRFVMNNINTIREVFQEDAPNNPVNTVISNVASYLGEEDLVEYENWLRTTQSGSLQYATGISAVNSARANMLWGTNNADIIIEAARGGAATLLVSTAIMFIMVFISILA